jgi:hypothetical protein
MSDLNKDFDYYTTHQDELVNKYAGKFIVIKDSEVQGAYETRDEAYAQARAKFELGTFIIQRVEPGTESYTQVFHSRVA